MTLAVPIDDRNRAALVPQSSSFVRLVLWLVLILGVLIASTDRAQTEVTSVSASPAFFSNAAGQSTTITVVATPGVGDLTIHVLTGDGGQLVRPGLVITEITTGVYTTVWDGKSDSGSNIGMGAYLLRVLKLATTSYLGPWGSVTVVGGEVSASPAVFSPTSSNVVQITVRGTPGQTGIKVQISRGPYEYQWYGAGCNSYLPLTETSTGVYSASWNAVNYVRQCGYSWMPDSFFMPDGTYTIYVIDGIGQGCRARGRSPFRLFPLPAPPAQPSLDESVTMALTCRRAEGTSI